MNDKKRDLMIKQINILKKCLWFSGILLIFCGSQLMFYRFIGLIEEFTGGQLFLALGCIIYGVVLLIFSHFAKKHGF